MTSEPLENFWLASQLCETCFLTSWQHLHRSNTDEYATVCCCCFFPSTHAVNSEFQLICKPPCSVINWSEVILNFLKMWKTDTCKCHHLVSGIHCSLSSTKINNFSFWVILTNSCYLLMALLCVFVCACMWTRKAAEGCERHWVEWV